MTRTLTGLVTVTDRDTGEVTELGEATLELPQPSHPVVIVVGGHHRAMAHRLIGHLAERDIQAVFTNSAKAMDRFSHALRDVMTMDLNIGIPKPNKPYWVKPIHKRRKGRS